MTWSQPGRAALCPPYARTMCALLVILVMLFASCRDGSSPEPPPPEAPPEFAFTAGTVYNYDVWTLDSFGYIIPSSGTSRAWRVLGTGQRFAGLDSVVVVADSVVRGAGAGKIVDTLHLQATSGGNLYAYGFLSRLMRRHGGAQVPARWDRIGDFSAGQGVSWIVGQLDSAGTISARGVMTGEREFVSATVNGVTTVFPARQIRLLGPGLDYTLWVSDAPTAFARLIEEPSDTSTGSVMDLTAMSGAAR